MTKVISLNKELVEQAGSLGAIKNLSAAEQIMHWATIGKMAEENPEIPYHFMKDLLDSREEMASQLDGYPYSPRKNT